MLRDIVEGIEERGGTIIDEGIGEIGGCDGKVFVLLKYK